MYTTCSTAVASTITGGAVWVEKTGNNPKQRTQINTSNFFIITIDFYFIILPGLPTTVTPSGTSWMITAPAPIVHHFPILTP